MFKSKLTHIVGVFLIAALLLGALPLGSAATVQGAPVAQVRSQQVGGTIPGGQFAKIWLGLTPTTQGATVTVISEWDRNNPGSQGLGFYILDQDGLNQVLSGSARLQDVNLAAGSQFGVDAPANQLGAQFQATGSSYTIVVYNDSNSDANFTLTATNAVITDDSDQVQDLSAPTPAATEEAEAEEAATAEATPVPATATPVPAATAVTTATATATPVAAVSSTPGVVRATQLRGELPNQNDQHYLGLEPSERDGNITLLLSFEPQDSSELARRLNFWVLDQNGLNRYLDPNENVILSNVAIAAGSADPQLAPNQRQASFKASGFGPYTVIVYNNSTVPATYELSIEGGVLVDDSGQTLTAQQALTTTTTTAPAAEGTATPAAQAATSGTAATSTTGTRQGQPGGTYTVQAGDTLSLIARDIYGDVNLWDELCSFNQLADCNRIEVGDVIQLPTRDQLASGAQAAPAATATPAPAVQATPTATPAATTAVTSTTAITATESMTETGAVTTTTTATTTTSAAPSASLNIVDTLVASGGFTTLVEALQAAGLDAALEGAGPFTVFAPTDAAFAALPAGAMDQLLANPTGQLTQILLFHILPGRVTSADITNGMQATTQQGKPVNFEVSGDSIKINGANLVVKDIPATNGVIHVIDAVILPPPD